MRKFVMSILAISALTACEELSSPETPDSATLNRSEAVGGPADYRTIDVRYAELVDRIPGFAGLYYEGEQLVVSLAGQRTAELSLEELIALEDLFGELNPGSGYDMPQRRWSTIQTRRVQHDFRQLLGWQRAVVATLGGNDNLVGYFIDKSANQVVVGVLPGTLTPDDILRYAPLPPGALRVEEGQPATTFLDRHRVPAPGGVRITTLHGGGGPCTLTTGALVKPAPYSGWDYAIAPSHCTPNFGSVGGGWWQPYESVMPLYNMGQEIRDPGYFIEGECPAGKRCRYSDAALFRVSQDTYLGRAVVSGTTYTGRVGWLSAMWPFEGEAVLKVGQTTGQTKGTITNDCINWTMHHSYTDDYYFLLCQIEAQISAQPGDSGAPLFRIWEGQQLLLGSLSGVRNTTYQLIIFSPIHSIIDDLERGYDRNICVDLNDAGCQ